ncbi:MAG TPA: CDP-alcohol phosphatidyltransferase family protein [Euryarchaeota archaeon]|nr:CDP-alcohol phosphatidyltransferase family protein [Euryarchaeota archaeon]
MVLNKYREKADRFLMPIARATARLGPNGLSVSSLFCALLAAILLIFWKDPLALLIAALLVIMNGLLDAVDGIVARISGKSSVRGDLVDHVIDRYSDFIMIAGISLSAFADARIGLLALGSILIVSYLGTQSQALGMKRDYSGMLGRAERILLILLFLLLQYAFEALGSGVFEVTSSVSLTLLDVLLVFFILAANITALQRFVRMWRALA